MESNNLMGAAALAMLAILAGSFIMIMDSDGHGDDMTVTNPAGPGDVQVGEATVSMKGNATTGYDWVVVSMPEGLKLVKDWYQSDSADKHIVGAGGAHYFTFSGEKGTYDVVLDYQRSWVGSEGNTVTVQVTIQ